MVNNSLEKSGRRELWRQRIAWQKTSGKTVRTFCREQRVSEYSFYWWRRELRGAEQPVRFALVETTAASAEGMPRPHQAQPQLELVLNGGERLRMPADAATLRLVFGVLREQVVDR